MNENNLSDKDKHRLRVAKEQHAQVEKKLKRAVKKHEKLTKETIEKEMRLLGSNIKGDLIVWKRDKKNDKIFYGFLNDEKYFNITAGLLNFTLKIENDEINKAYRKKTSRTMHTSTELKKLQKIANDILVKFISRS